LLLPLQDAYVAKLSVRLMLPSSTHLLGTDELGRDLLSRFIAGTKYTILTALLTTLVAGASGWLMGRAALAAPTWFGRLLTVLAYICFVVPSFLLAARWPNRLLTAILCILPILPLFAIALIAIAVGKLTSWAASLALGPLLGVGIAYIIYRADRLNGAASQADRDHLFRQLAALMASMFAWGAYLHAALDILGLGMQPPEPSWGSMLIAQSASWWPQATAALGFLTIGMIAFLFSDTVSGVRDEKSYFDKHE